ncbi:hypothetical protein BJ170DRAFT_713364 [Xylariales sp. AK1849]|nr:hypothetical protein BJ170DRAFT_713364 [Xylariales sp. AK1849]
MSTPKQMPSNAQTRAATLAVAYALSDLKYAVVGGGACSMLGSMHETEDVDFVVPKNGTKNARDLLKKQPDHFEIDKKTLHTSYKSDPKVEIEILTPPALFREEYTESTPIIMIDGVRILKPALISNAKCRSILGRHAEGKKQSDATDILFLLGWCYTKKMHPTSTEIPNATKDFVLNFISVYGGEKLWRDTGYNLDDGTFSN